MLIAALALASGCASEAGWAPTRATTCAPKAPAQVCSRAEPDFGHTLTVGDAALVPGECAALDAEGRGGLVRLETRDPRGEGRRRWIRAPKGKVTIVEVAEDGRARPVDRQACDATPIDVGGS